MLECNGSDGPSCLTAPQVDVAGKLYASAANIEAKRATFPGMMPGSELGWDRSMVFSHLRLARVISGIWYSRTPPGISGVSTLIAIVQLRTGEPIDHSD